MSQIEYQVSMIQLEIPTVPFYSEYIYIDFKVHIENKQRCSLCLWYHIKKNNCKGQ